MSGCSNELTAVDVQGSPSLQGRVAGGTSEESNLFGIIDRDNVYGLNMTVPEDAKEMIKPWDQRESLVRFGESSVDDQVRKNTIHVTC
jgi:hypothetical protein